MGFQEKILPWLLSPSQSMEDTLESEMPLFTGIAFTVALRFHT